MLFAFSAVAQQSGKSKSKSKLYEKSGPEGAEAQIPVRQAEDCFKPFYWDGMSALSQNNFRVALDRFEAAASCKDKSRAEQRALDSVVAVTKEKLDKTLTDVKRTNLIVGATANALKHAEHSPTLALRLAHEAGKFRRNMDVLADETRQRILENPENQFCQDPFHFEPDPVSLDVSPDGIWLAFVAADGQAGLVSTVDRQTLPLETPAPASLARFSEQADLVLVADSDNNLSVFDLTGKRLRQHSIEKNAQIRAIAFSPDGTRIAAGLEAEGRGIVRVWNDSPADTSFLTDFFYREGVLSLCFLPDGKRIAAGFRDFTAQVFEIRPGEKNPSPEKQPPAMPLFGHGQIVTGLAASPDGLWVCSASHDKTAKIWCASDGSLLTTLRGHDDWVLSVTFSKNSRFIATTSTDNTVKLWDLNGNCLKTFREHLQPVLALSFSPSGNNLFTAGKDRTLRTWHRPLWFPGENLPHARAIVALAPSPAGNWFVTGSLDKTAKCWDTETARVLWTFQAEDQVIAADVSPDGKTVALGLWNGQIHLLTNEGVRFRTLSGHTTSIYSLAFSADSRSLISGSRDNTAKCWQIDSPEPFNTIQHRGRVVAVDYSKKGKKILTSGWDGSLRFGASDGMGKKSKSVRFGSAIQSVEWSPGGEQILISGEAGLAKLLDADGRQIADFKHPADCSLPSDCDVHSSCFSSDGKFVLTGDQDGYVRLFSQKGGEPLRAVKMHAGQVFSVRAMPNSGQFLSCGQDGLAKLFDENLRVVRVFRGHEGNIAWASFSNPEGKPAIATASAGSRDLYLWGEDKNLRQRLPPIQPSGELAAFATSKENTRFALAGLDDGGVFIWKDFDAGLRPKEIARHKSPVTALACFETGERFVSADASGEVDVWDSEGRQLVKRQFRSRITALALLPGDSLVLLGFAPTFDNDAPNALTWNWEKDLLRTVFGSGGIGAANCAASSANGRLIALGNDETGSIEIYQSGGRHLKTLYAGSVKSLDFCPADSSLLLSLSTFGALSIWDASAEKLADHRLFNFSLPGDKIVAAAFMPGGEEIMVCGEKTGPQFLQNHLHKLNLPVQIAHLTPAQRNEFGLKMDFEECYRSANPEDLLFCAEFFQEEFLSNRNFESLDKAIELVEKVAKARGKVSDFQKLAHLCELQITAFDETVGAKDFSGTTVWTLKHAQALENVLALESSPANANQLYEAWWSRSWYCVLAGQYWGALEAVEASTKTPTPQAQKHGILSNKALALLLSGQMKEARDFYCLWADQPWADTRHDSFRGAFLDDLDYLRKNLPPGRLSKKQLENMGLIEKMLLEKGGCD